MNETTWPTPQPTIVSRDVAQDGVPRARTSGGSPRRRAAGLAAAAAAICAGVVAGHYLALSQQPAQQQAVPQQVQQPVAPPVTVAALAVSRPLPTTADGLVQVLQADPTVAGSAGPQLETALQRVVATTGEERRQGSLAVLQLTHGGQLADEYARAAATAVTPFTRLGTPADVIADLTPNPGAAGPNAHFVLNCMHELTEGTPAEQRAEAGEILEKLSRWAANGGVRADVAAATQNIATVVAQGGQPG